MNSASDPPRRRGWLKIDLERAIEERGELHAARVYCPPRDKTITLDECAACSHCTGCVIDSGSKEWLLRCERALSAQEPSEPERARAGSDSPADAPPTSDPQA